VSPINSGPPFCSVHPLRPIQGLRRAKTFRTRSSIPIQHVLSTALCGDRVAHGHGLGELIHRGVRLRRQVRQRVRTERFAVMNRAGTDSRSGATADTRVICGLMLGGRPLCRS
jgi:hypothetical protein